VLINREKGWTYDSFVMEKNLQRGAEGHHSTGREVMHMSRYAPLNQLELDAIGLLGGFQVPVGLAQRFPARKAKQGSKKSSTLLIN
jgi:hypothetical protein